MRPDAALEQIDQRWNVTAQANPSARFIQVLPTDAAKLGIVADQIGQLPTLLDQVALGQPANLLVKVGRAEDLAQHRPRVIEAEGLIEIGGNQVVRGRQAGSRVDRL